MGRAERVLLGQIVGAHGVRGDVLVKTFTQETDGIAAYELTDADGQRPLRLKVQRVTAKGLIAQVAGVSDRNGAEALKRRELWVARHELPETAEDEFYYVDLVGLTAVDGRGEPFGKVVEVVNFGAGDLIEIALKGTGKTEMVPFKTDFVPEVDVAGGRVVVAWPLQFEVADAGQSESAQADESATENGDD